MIPNYKAMVGKALPSEYMQENKHYVPFGLGYRFPMKRVERYSPAVTVDIDTNTYWIPCTIAEYEQHCGEFSLEKVE